MIDDAAPLAGLANGEQRRGVIRRSGGRSSVYVKSEYARWVPQCRHLKR